VAYEALRLLHLDMPEVQPEQLPELGSLEDTPDACVKACYRCVLSYFNQPDHDVVNRNDPEARRVLLRLAASTTALSSSDDSVGGEGAPQSDEAGTEWFHRWKAELAASGVTLPAWTLAGNAVPQWPAAYAAVVLPDTPGELEQRLKDEGVTLTSFPKDTSRWPELFARLARYLGASLG
jgi:hypothetical protein